MYIYIYVIYWLINHSPIQYFLNPSVIQGYKLHVFLTSEGGWSYPSSHDWSSIAGYAGAGAIFGGRAEECH